MLMNEDNEQFIVSGLDARRHTEKLEFIKVDTKNIFSGLEQVDEEIDYKKGNEFASGNAGVWYNAINNASGKVIIVKTLDLTELNKDAVDDRVEYLHKNIDIVKEVYNENIINYISVVESDK